MTDKITAALIDPHWKWGRLEINKTPFITLEHPEWGDITCILAEETLDGMISGLTKIKAMRP